MSKKAFTQFHVRDADELDVFDDYNAYLETDGYFYVIQEDSGEKHFPRWCIRQNGDIDGFEGWSDTPLDDEDMPNA